MKLINLLFSVIALALLCACSLSSPNVDVKVRVEHNTDSLAPTLVADTIVYLVYVRPQNPADETEVQYLSHLQNEKLIDLIFESIYSHGAKAYDFLTGNELSIDDIKTLEVEDERYSRSNVSVIQFTESWSFDAKNLSFDKKVLKIHVGYAVTDEDGVIVANRPGWVINMKN